MSPKTLPFMKLYVDDYLGSLKVAQMSLAEEGAYLRLLMFAWKDGSLPRDLSQLCRFCRLDPTVPEHRGLVGRVVEWCFEEHPDDPSRIVNPRQVAERDKAMRVGKARHAAASTAAQERWRKLREDASRIRDAVPDACVADASLASGYGSLEGSGVEGKEGSGEEREVTMPQPSKYVITCVMTVNRELDQRLASAFSPLVSTVEATGVGAQWESEGIPIEVVIPVLLERTRAYQFGRRGKQPYSLTYFDQAVRAAWEKHQASKASNSGVLPSNSAAGKAAPKLREWAG